MDRSGNIKSIFGAFQETGGTTNTVNNILTTVERLPQDYIKSVSATTPNTLSFINQDDIELLFDTPENPIVDIQTTENTDNKTITWTFENNDEGFTNIPTKFIKTSEVDSNGNLILTDDAGNITTFAIPEHIKTATTTTSTGQKTLTLTNNTETTITQFQTPENPIVDMETADNGDTKTLTWTYDDANTGTTTIPIKYLKSTSIVNDSLIITDNTGTTTTFTIPDVSNSVNSASISTVSGQKILTLVNPDNTEINFSTPANPIVDMTTTQNTDDKTITWTYDNYNEGFTTIPTKFIKTSEVNQNGDLVLTDQAGDMTTVFIPDTSTHLTSATVATAQGTKTLTLTNQSNTQVSFSTPDNPIVSMNTVHTADTKTVIWTYDNAEEGFTTIPKTFIRSGVFNQDGDLILTDQSGDTLTLTLPNNLIKSAQVNTILGRNTLTLINQDNTEITFSTPTNPVTNVKTITTTEGETAIRWTYDDNTQDLTILPTAFVNNAEVDGSGNLVLTHQSGDVITLYVPQNLIKSAQVNTVSAIKTLTLTDQDDIQTTFSTHENPIVDMETTENTDTQTITWTYQDNTEAFTTIPTKYVKSGVFNQDGNLVLTNQAGEVSTLVLPDKFIKNAQVNTISSIKTLTLTNQDDVETTFHTHDNPIVALDIIDTTSAGFIPDRKTIIWTYQNNAEAFTTIPTKYIKNAELNADEDILFTDQSGEETIILLPHNFIKSAGIATVASIKILTLTNQDDTTFVFSTHANPIVALDIIDTTSAGFIPNIKTIIWTYENGDDAFTTIPTKYIRSGSFNQDGDYVFTDQSGDTEILTLPHELIKSAQVNTASSIRTLTLTDQDNTQTTFSTHINPIVALDIIDMTSAGFIPNIKTIIWTYENGDEAFSTIPTKYIRSGELNAQGNIVLTDQSGDTTTFVIPINYLQSVVSLANSGLRFIYYDTTTFDYNLPNHLSSINVTIANDVRTFSIADNQNGETTFKLPNVFIQDINLTNNAQDYELSWLKTDDTTGTVEIPATYVKDVDSKGNGAILFTLTNGTTLEYNTKETIVTLLNGTELIYQNTFHPQHITSITSDGKNNLTIIDNSGNTLEVRADNSAVLTEIDLGLACDGLTDDGFILNQAIDGLSKDHHTIHISTPHALTISRRIHIPSHITLILDCVVYITQQGALQIYGDLDATQMELTQVAYENDTEISIASTANFKVGDGFKITDPKTIDEFYFTDNAINDIPYKMEVCVIKQIVNETTLKIEGKLSNTYERNYDRISYIRKITFIENVIIKNAIFKYQMPNFDNFLVKAEYGKNIKIDNLTLNHNTKNTDLLVTKRTGNAFVWSEPYEPTFMQVNTIESNYPGGMNQYLLDLAIAEGLSENAIPDALDPKRNTMPRYTLIRYIQETENSIANSQMNIVSGSNDTLTIDGQTYIAPPGNVAFATFAQTLDDEFEFKIGIIQITLNSNTFTSKGYTYTHPSGYFHPETIATNIKNFMRQNGYNSFDLIYETNINSANKFKYRITFPNTTVTGNILTKLGFSSTSVSIGNGNVWANNIVGRDSTGISIDYNAGTGKFEFTNMPFFSRVEGNMLPALGFNSLGITVGADFTGSLTSIESDRSLETATTYEFQTDGKIFKNFASIFEDGRHSYEAIATKLQTEMNLETPALRPRTYDVSFNGEEGKFTIKMNSIAGQNMVQGFAIPTEFFHLGSLLGFSHIPNDPATGLPYLKDFFSGFIQNEDGTDANGNFHISTGGRCDDGFFVGLGSAILFEGQSAQLDYNLPYTIQSAYKYISAVIQNKYGSDDLDFSITKDKDTHITTIKNSKGKVFNMTVGANSTFRFLFNKSGLNFTGQSSYVMENTSLSQSNAKHGVFVLENCVNSKITNCSILHTAQSSFVGMSLITSKNCIMDANTVTGGDIGFLVDNSSYCKVHNCITIDNGKEAFSLGALNSKYNVIDSCADRGGDFNKNNEKSATIVFGNDEIHGGASKNVVSNITCENRTHYPISLPIQNKKNADAVYTQYYPGQQMDSHALVSTVDLAGANYTYHMIFRIDTLVGNTRSDFLTINNDLPTSNGNRRRILFFAQQSTRTIAVQIVDASNIDAFNTSFVIESIFDGEYHSLDLIIGIGEFSLYVDKKLVTQDLTIPAYNYGSDVKYVWFLMNYDLDISTGTGDLREFIVYNKVKTQKEIEMLYDAFFKPYKKHAFVQFNCNSKDNIVKDCYVKNVDQFVEFKEAVYIDLDLLTQLDIENNTITRCICDGIYLDIGRIELLNGIRDRDIQLTAGFANDVILYDLSVNGNRYTKVSQMIPINELNTEINEFFQDIAGLEDFEISYDVEIQQFLIRADGMDISGTLLTELGYNNESYININSAIASDLPTGENDINIVSGMRVAETRVTDCVFINPKRGWNLNCQFENQIDNLIINRPIYELRKDLDLNGINYINLYTQGEAQVTQLNMDFNNRVVANLGGTII